MRDAETRRGGDAETTRLARHLIVVSPRLRVSPSPRLRICHPAGAPALILGGLFNGR